MWHYDILNANDTNPYLLIRYSFYLCLVTLLISILWWLIGVHRTFSACYHCFQRYGIIPQRILITLQLNELFIELLSLWISVCKGKLTAHFGRDFANDFNLKIAWTQKWFGAINTFFFDEVCHFCFFSFLFQNYTSRGLTIWIQFKLYSFVTIAMASSPLSKRRRSRTLSRRLSLRQTPHNISNHSIHEASPLLYEENDDDAERRLRQKKKMLELQRKNMPSPLQSK